VERRDEILSRALARSSDSEVFCLSRRSIWVWRSRTVRSTLRIERASAVRVLSADSRAFSSCRGI